MASRIASTARSARSAATTLLLLAGVLIPIGATRASTGGELLITEYVEGSGTNQAIELFNPTDNPVSLGASGYMLAFYNDGSTDITGGVPLVGTIQPGGTWVITPTNAGSTLLAKANQEFGTSWYDGNDAVALLLGGTAIDVIGQIGFDPGIGGWGSGATSTTDHTLRRQATVTAGDPNGSDPFDPAVEWTGYPIDTFDGLGNVNERIANAPVAITCPAPVSTTEGTAASAVVSASDPDGIVVGVAVTGVTPSDPGSFSVANVVPAPSAGGTATATLEVGDSTPAGTYSVSLTAANQDATPQTASCDVTVTVDPAPPPPPPPPSLDGLRQLVGSMVADGAVNPDKAFLLEDRLDRAAQDLAAGRTDAYLAQLRALANQAEGLAPRWLTQPAADEIAAAAGALAKAS